MTTRPTRSLAIALATTPSAQLAHHGLHGVPRRHDPNHPSGGQLGSCGVKRLDTLFLGCIDNVVFPPIVAADECGGAVSLVDQPAFVTLPGSCPSEFTEKKITTLSDECGNVTEVEQVIVVQDNAPPIWLNAPDELIVTDNINGEVFDEPVRKTCAPMWW